MTVHELQRASHGTGPHYYFACDHCGWCMPLRATPEAARLDGLAHEVEADKLPLRSAEQR